MANLPKAYKNVKIKDEKNKHNIPHRLKSSLNGFEPRP